MESTGDSLIGYWLVFGLAFGSISGAVWSNKGGPFGVGFFLGALLGLIGLFIAVVVMTPPEVKDAERHAATMRACPHCKEGMRRDASVCPHCQRDSEPWEFHDGRWWTRSYDGSWHYLDKKEQWVKNEEAKD